MVKFELFLAALMIISPLTTLVVEAIKKILAEHNRKYRANTLAAIVSTILSAAIGVGYVIFTNGQFTVQIIICIIALVFMSWLCAMVGYDKVIGLFKKD